MITLILSSNCLVLISCSKNLILGKSDFSLSSSLLRCSNFFPNNFSYFIMPLFIRLFLAFHSLLEETAGVILMILRTGLHWLFRHYVEQDLSTIMHFKYKISIKNPRLKVPNQIHLCWVLRQTKQWCRGRWTPTKIEFLEHTPDFVAPVSVLPCALPETPKWALQPRG